MIYWREKNKQMCPVLLWMHQFECFKNTIKTDKCDLGDYECSNVSALRNHLPFYRIQVFPLSGLWTPASLTHFVKRALWNFADVTLADDDNNSMLSEGDSKAFWGSDVHNLDGDRATGWRGDRCTSRARSLARWCRSFMERWRWCMLERVGKTFLRISSVRGVPPLPPYTDFF